MADPNDHPAPPEATDEELANAARRAVGALRQGVAAAAGGVASVAEPIVDRVQGVLAGAERTWTERPGARVRRVRRMGAHPLPSLYDLHPDARQARPVEVGLRTIDIADIAGTAVGGGDQRGGDFLPLKPFRGKNWSGRWQRLRRAQDRLAILPPIDVVKYADHYWVLDGHNRVALALYSGQVGIDASVVELVPMGSTRSEPIGSLAATVAESRGVRAAGRGQRASDELARNEATSLAELDAGAADAPDAADRDLAEPDLAGNDLAEAEP